MSKGSRRHEVPCTGSPFSQEEVQGDFVEDEYSSDDAHEDYVEGEYSSGDGEEEPSFAGDEFCGDDLEDDGQFVNEEDDAVETVGGARAEHLGAPFTVVVNTGEPALHGAGDKKVKEVNLHISIKTSLAEACKNVACCEPPICWTMDPCCLEQVFCCTHYYGETMGGIVKREKPEGDLSNAIVIGAKVNSFRNTGPIDLGVVIPGVHGSHVGSSGKKFAYIIPARTDALTMVPSGQSSVFDGYKGLNIDAISKFEDMQPDKLREGIMDAHDPGMYHVPKDHVVIGILMHNAKTNPGFRMNYDDLVEAQMNPLSTTMEIPKSKVDAVIDTIQCDLKPQRPCTDFNKFRICLERPDCKSYDDVSNICNMYGADKKCGANAEEKYRYLCGEFVVHSHITLYIIHPDSC